MEIEKTGTFIKELRKEAGMTQKDLANLLHITDKAVSKWERGLSAPDIAILEQLAKILHVSITELFCGERAEMDTDRVDIEVNVKNILDYSKKEIDMKRKLLRGKYTLIACLCAAFAVILCLSILWGQGFFSRIDQVKSPNGLITVTAYDRDIMRLGDMPSPSVTIKTTGEWITNSVYGNCTYQGAWWAPDGKQYVLSLKTADGTRLLLEDVENNSEINLNVFLSTGAALSELGIYGLQENEAGLSIDYQFLQWSEDGRTMLIYYSFLDAEQLSHSGYFWFSYEDGRVYATMETVPHAER